MSSETTFEKIYDDYGREIAPTDPNNPMFSELYCQRYITDCDRVIKLKFGNIFGDVNVNPLTIRIDASYNTLYSIQRELEKHIDEYPSLERLNYQ